VDRDTEATVSKNAPSADDALVLLAKSGDGCAYAELCRRHSRQVFLTVRRITKTREDAEDAVQESLLKALIHLEGFDGRSSFSTWLTRIAINSALMIMRKRRSRPELSIDWEEETGSVRYLRIADSRLSSEDQLHIDERDKLIRSAIGKLPPKLRIPVQLQLSEEVPVRELAALLGISVAATKSRLLRARIHLRRSCIKEFAPRLN
jgi:RNA polymerase sigma-70 factor (ECF subfamily)